MPRFFCPAPLASGARIELPPGAARHVQVLRLQPGATLTLFNGAGGEFAATVIRMGRSDVQVEIGAHAGVEREAPREVHLAIGMPANERMDWLVEKATELGVTSLQPLLAERSVLRLKGERADKKRAHWQGIAVAACEQCGRNRVPQVPVVAPLHQWLTRQAADPHTTGVRLLLSFRAGARPLREAVPADALQVTVLAGPEGGLSPAEEQQALDHGFIPVSLGPRVLRAETAALAALTLLA